jgi:hypothetical protein
MKTKSLGAARQTGFIRTGLFFFSNGTRVSKQIHFNNFANASQLTFDHQLYDNKPFENYIPANCQAEKHSGF